MSYLTPTGSFFVQTAPESYRLFRTYNKSEAKPVKPASVAGTDNGWSPNNTDGAVWMCEKSAITINEGTWGEVIRIKGEDGIPGPMGNSGRLPYPAGIWSNTETYKCTAKTAAFIYYEPGQMYYVLNKEGSFSGINPADDYTVNGLNATWIPFENYKAIFIEMAFIRFGLLGKAIFYDDYMFSQHGIDINGNGTSDYSRFNPDKLGMEDCPFTPNIYLNFYTGDIYVANGIFKGKIYADSGILKNVSLLSNEAGDRIEISSEDKKITLYNSRDEVVGEWSFSNSYGSNIRLWANGGAAMAELTPRTLQIGEFDIFSQLTSTGIYTGGTRGVFSVSTSSTDDTYLKIRIQGLPVGRNSVNSGECFLESSGSDYVIKIKK